MRQNTRFFTHASVISALFILGNAVIILPTGNANEFTFLGYLAAAVLGFLLYLIVLPAAKRLFCENAAIGKSKFLKAGLCLVYTFTAIFALWCAADAFGNFISFINKVILPDTPIFFTAAIFTAVVAFFATRRQEDILKFFLIAFWFVLAIILFFFVATSFKFNLRNIFVFELPKMKTLISQAKPYFFNPLIPALLLPVYNVLTFKNVRPGAAFTGLASGLILLGLCIIGSILLFGAPLAGRLPYPYSSAISTVSIGRLFSRLDGFSYFIYFACALAKITVCLFVMFSSLKRIRNILQKNGKSLSSTE